MDALQRTVAGDSRKRGLANLTPYGVIIYGPTDGCADSYSSPKQFEQYLRDEKKERRSDEYIDKNP
jgi:hypothetical protein